MPEHDEGEGEEGVEEEMGGAAEGYVDVPKREKKEDRVEHQ